MPLVNNLNSDKLILAIVGPKGGVGKSTISANIAISLANIGKKIVAADLDLGAANLHAILGVRDYRYSLDDFLLKKVKNLEDIVIDSGVKNLRIICGGSQIPDIANMPFQQKAKLIQHLTRFDGDVLILDLAAGSSFNVVDFLFIAHKSVIVTTPEITSLMNVYSFIKSSVFRRLKFHYKSAKSFDVLKLLDQARDVSENPHLSTVESFFTEAEKLDYKSTESARRVLNEFCPFIVINRSVKQGDSKVGKAIQGLMEQYVSIKSFVLTDIPEDEAVPKSIMKMKPTVLESPQSGFSRAIHALALSLIAN